MNNQFVFTTILNNNFNIENIFQQILENIHNTNIIEINNLHDNLNNNLQDNLNDNLQDNLHDNLNNNLQDNLQDNLHDNSNNDEYVEFHIEFGYYNEELSENNYFKSCEEINNKLGHPCKIKKDDSILNEKCLICIENYKINELKRVLPKCQHFFHKKCIDKWFKKNASCPICRDKIF